MKKLGKPGIFLTIVFGIAILQSCNKDDIQTPSKIETKTKVTDYINLIQSFSLATVEEVISTDDDLKSAILSVCLNVTIYENENGEFWPRIWTLDWGSENCECFSGILKRGKVHVSLSDWWRNEGSLREITFEDFYINDNKMEGVKTILNTGVNEAGNLTFEKKVTDAKLTYSDESVITWNCERYSEQVGGGETFLFADDVWSVTGNGSGVNLDDNAYTLEITSALIYQNGCFYPVSGTIEINSDGEELKTIDYGNGECDNIITVTVGETTETIEL
jgi:hypothetical protein